MTRTALEHIESFVVLQGGLVEAFLRHCKPEDLDRFRGIPEGDLTLDGTMWVYHRHGRGVRFTSLDGATVNAHVAMVEHPHAFDAGRLFECFESIRVASFEYAQRRFATSVPELRALLATLHTSGLARIVREERGTYELTYPPEPRAGSR